MPNAVADLGLRSCVKTRDGGITDFLILVTLIELNVEGALYFANNVIQI